MAQVYSCVACGLRKLCGGADFRKTGTSSVYLIQLQQANLFILSWLELRLGQVIYGGYHRNPKVQIPMLHDVSLRTTTELPISWVLGGEGT